MKIFKILPTGRKVRRECSENEYIDSYALTGWAPEDSTHHTPLDVSIILDRKKGWDKIAALPQIAQQNIFTDVEIRKDGRNITVPYIDFLLRWKKNGWFLRRGFKRPKFILSRHVLYRKYKTSRLVKIQRSDAQVVHAFGWDRSPISEKIYKKTRPQRYWKEYAMLMSSHKLFINPQWFTWAARKITAMYFYRRRYGGNFYTHEELEHWALLNSDDEPNRIVMVRDLTLE